MKKNIKKMLCGLLSAAILAGTAVTGYAETVYYTITANTDTLSMKAMKNSVYYENRAYVTATYFSGRGSFQCMSVCYNQRNIVTEDMYVAGTGGYTESRASGEYHPQAPGGVYYFMSASSNTTGLNMQGRYTP